MKLNFILSFVALLIICSCNSKTKESKAIIQETTKTVEGIKKSEDFRERLKRLDPATEKQLKSWLSTTIGKFNRTEFKKIRGSQNDIATAGAIFSSDDPNKTFEITIADGASKDGLLAIQSHYMAQTLELNTIKASGHEKTYEKNDLKVLETYVKKDEFYRMSFLYDMRFGITVESNGLSYDEVWQAISELNLKELKDL